MNNFKIEEALRKINAVNGFLRLLCCTAAESAGYSDFGEYYDLFDLMETTQREGIEEITAEINGGTKEATTA